MTTLLLLVAVAGFAFFTIRWLQLRSGYNAMSGVERTYAEMTADTNKAKAKRNTPLRRLRNKIESLGLGRSIIPLLLAAAFAYIIVIMLLRLAGITGILAAILALPIGMLVISLLYRWAQRRRVDEFNNQMITMLELLTAQVKAGNGVERSLVNIVPALPQPIRSELQKALDAAATGGDLIASLQELCDAYPSRAFRMFLAALEIDKTEGHTITPALTQAAELLKRSFALQSEARAELSSTRWEFIGVSIILLAIAGKMVLGNIQTPGSVFTTPLGVGVLILCFGNAAFGVWRFNRMIAGMRKDTE